MESKYQNLKCKQIQRHKGKKKKKGRQRLTHPWAELTEQRLASGKFNHNLTLNSSQYLSPGLAKAASLEF